jgi:hypothetical protein
MLEGVTVTPDPATDNVNVCVVVPAPLVAVRINPNVPDVVGVPLMVPVLLPLFVNPIPLGRFPVSETLGGGKPVVATVKELAVFNAKLTLPRLVKAGR